MRLNSNCQGGRSALPSLGSNLPTLPDNSVNNTESNQPELQSNYFKLMAYRQHNEFEVKIKWQAQKNHLIHTGTAIASKMVRLLTNLKHRWETRLNFKLLKRYY